MAPKITSSASQLVEYSIRLHSRDGDQIIVWVQDDNFGNKSLYKKEYRSGVWIHPASLADKINPSGGGDVDDEHFQVVMNNNGDVVIVWQQEDDTGDYGLFKSEYRAGAWRHPSDINDSIADGSTYSWNSRFRVEMNDSGDTVIAWWQQDQNTSDWYVFKSDYRSGAWTYPATFADSISPIGSDGWSSIQLAMDTQGNTFIVWQQTDGAGEAQVFKSEYRLGAWVHPANAADNISPGGDDVIDGSLEVAMNIPGDMIVTWVQRDGGGVPALFKSEYRSGLWTHPSSLADKISPSGSAVFEGATVKLDNNGNALVVWTQDDGTGKIQLYKSEYRLGSWTHPVNLADKVNPSGSELYQSCGSSSECHAVIMDDLGNALIVWRQVDGAGAIQLYKSEYRAGSWTHPFNLADYFSPVGGDLGVGPFSQMATDTSGNFLVVWNQENGAGEYSVYKSEYRSGAWVHPVGLADHLNPAGRTAWDSRVVMDSNGEAIIAWAQTDDSQRSQLFKSEYRSGVWTHPADDKDHGTYFSQAGVEEAEHDLVMNDKGDMVLIWVQKDSAGDHHLFKSEYRAGAWASPSSAADAISPRGGGRIWGIQAAMDESGNTIVVWSQEDGTEYQIYKSEYRSGTWTHPSGLADNISPNTSRAIAASVRMDNSNNAVIVWEQEDSNGKFQIYKSDYRAGVWTHPAALADHINPSTDDVGVPKIFMASSGITLIVWEQKDGGGKFQSYKSELRNGIWTHPVNSADHFSPAGSEVAEFSSSVKMDKNGNALIVWAQEDGAGKFQNYMSEYRLGQWTHPVGLADHYNPVGSEVAPHSSSIVMDENGNALVIWAQKDSLGEYQKYMSQYRSGVWSHPAALGDHFNPSGGDIEEYADHFVVMSENGQALIVWEQEDSLGKNQLYKSEYSQGSWRHPASLAELLNPSGSEVVKASFSVAIDSSGNALIAWVQKDASGDNHVYKSERRSNLWMHPAGLTDKVSPRSSQNENGIVVGMGDNGNAIILWSQDDGLKDRQIYKSEYR